MKISLALGPRQPLSRQTAWGCLTTNLAAPGLGSLVAGRASGYAQAALAVGGVILTCVFGVRFIVWYLAHRSLFQEPQADELDPLLQMWQVLRWVLLGLGTFGLGWLWALASSLQIVLAAKKDERANEPPRLP